MVDMPMSIDDHQRLKAMAVDETEKLILFSCVGTSWVDDDTFFDIIIVNDVSVFGKGIKDKLFEF